MANRDIKLIIKNSDIVNRPLPTSLLSGEAIVNTAEGIMLFSGVTSSTNEWVSAGTGINANFFEVGSNLYDLQLRNRLTKYEGITGPGLVGKFLSGTTNGFVLSDIGDITGVDSYTTGGTYNPTTEEITLSLNVGKPDVVITGLENTFTTGSTLVGSTLYFDTNKNFSAYTADLSILDTNDTFVTGLTYSNSLLTLDRNDAQPQLSTIIDSVSGLTISNLTDGRVVYVGAGGVLTDETGFEYNESTNTMLVGNINTSTTGEVIIGTGGLTVGSGGSTDISGTGDVVIHGNLTVFGDAITASTSELYIEDNNIILNYNPTGDTSLSSISAGLTIQDGDGINSDISLTIRAMNNFTGINPSDTPDVSEYTGPNGSENRGFITELNDIVIRSNNVSTPNGVRLIAEFDTINGGTF